MRKRITNQGAESVSPSNQQWMNVEDLAQVEVSSEDAAHPIDSAWYQMPDRAGERDNLGSKQSGFCSTSRR